MTRAPSLRALALAACAVCLPSLTAEASPHFGVQLDAGVPDLAGLNAVFRPVPFLRLQGGVLFNGVGAGLRGGVSVVPLSTFVSPSLTVEYGRYFAADGTLPLGAVGLPVGHLEPALRRLSYDFANAHLGVEVGPPERFSVFLRAGLSYVNTTLGGSGALLQEAVGDPTLTMQDLRVRGFLPSVKLGFLYFFG